MSLRLPSFRTLLSASLLVASTQALAAGTLVYGAPGEPVTLDPGNASDSPSLQVQTQLYDRLEISNLEPAPLRPAWP